MNMQFVLLIDGIPFPQKKKQKEKRKEKTIYPDQKLEGKISDCQ